MEGRVRFDPFEEIRETLRVARLEGARVVATEKADVSGNAAGEDGEARRKRLGYDVGAALGSRRDHQQPRAGEHRPDFRARPISQPAVVRVPFHLGHGSTLHRRAESSAESNDANSRAGRKPSRREGCTERILHRPEMGDHANVERAPRRQRSPLDRRCRLVDDPRSRPKARGKLPYGERLQDDESCGEIEDLAAPPTALDFPINVGAGECHHDGKAGMKPPGFLHGRPALSGVKGDQEIAGLIAVSRSDPRSVAELPEDSGPASRGRSVPLARPHGSGADDEDPHFPARVFHERGPVVSSVNPPRRIGRMMKRSLAGAALVTLVIGMEGALLASPRENPWNSTALYEIEYSVKLGDLTPAGSHVALWVPYPAENRDQRVAEAKIESPWPWALHREDKHGNRMIHLEGAADPATSDLVMRFRVERKPSRGVPLSEGAMEGVLSPALYRNADRLVPLSGLIRIIANQEAQGRETQREKVWAFYDYVYRTMSYNKDGTGWGRGDAVWACESKRGNCTDFHSLFIAMLRSQEIPARFLIGFPIPEGPEGKVGGYHCWAEFFDSERGWLPVDASEAKKKGMREAYFGSLPNDRIEFTVGRDLVLSPPQKGEPLNYFIYPYAEVDGKPAPELKREFRFHRIEPSTSS